MSSQTIPVAPFDCVIFGGTGDLAERKILPVFIIGKLQGNSQIQHAFSVHLGVNWMMRRIAHLRKKRLRRI